MNTIPPHELRYKKPASGFTFIYGLIDPDTQDLRYIGKTSRLQERLWHHMVVQNNDAMRQWIANLRFRNSKPLVQVIEEVPLENWQDRERYWIAFYREQGTPLTNFAPGGVDAPHTPESIAKAAAARRGVKCAPLSAEHRRKIADGIRGHKRSPETIAKMSQAKKEWHAKRKLLSSE